MSWDNIVKALNDLHDSIGEFLQFDELKQIMKTSEYDFSQFRSEILKLMKFGQRSGLSDLVCAQIVIKTKKDEDDEYIADVSVYFRDDNGKPQKIKKQYAIHGFSYIPESVSCGLKDKGEETITFYLEDLEEFAENKDLPINTYKREMPELIRKQAKKASLKANDKLLVKINNFILYYRVKVMKWSEEEGKEQYVGEFLTTHLYGLTEKDWQKLEEENELTIQYGL